MGYNTKFAGHFTIEPPLNAAELEFLRDFTASRHDLYEDKPLRAPGEQPYQPLVYGQTAAEEQYERNSADVAKPGAKPDSWCALTFTADTISLDDGKNYDAVRWVEWVINNLLSPASREITQRHAADDVRLAHFTSNHTVEGVVTAQGENVGDLWYLRVHNNQVTKKVAVEPLWD